MRTDATLLPPVHGRDHDDALDGESLFAARSFRSEHTLATVGVEAVLGAMIEQRRQSPPSFVAVVARPADPARAEAFLKAR